MHTNQKLGSQEVKKQTSGYVFELWIQPGFIWTIPWKSSMGPCSGWGVAWLFSGRTCWDRGGTSPCSPLRRDSSSSSSRILLFSLTQLGQEDVEGSSAFWLSSSFSSTFRLGTVKLLSEESNPELSAAVSHLLGRNDWDLDLLESSREASRTSLKIRSIFFLLAGGWPSGSSLGCLFGRDLPCRAVCRHKVLKSFRQLGSTAGFPISGIK